jgi:cyclase
LELTKAISESVAIPVIASGGPGKPEHVAAAIVEGKADAVALGTLLHFRISSLPEIKDCLRRAHLSVRPIERSGDDVHKATL